MFMHKYHITIVYNFGGIIFFCIFFKNAMKEGVYFLYIFPCLVRYEHFNIHPIMLQK